MRLLSIAVLTSFFAFSGCVRTPQPSESPAKISRSAEQIETASKPGEGHKVFEDLVGSWKYSIKLWMDPSSPPQELEGKSKNSLIYGGRHLVQEFWGEAGGEHFEGRATTSYDNVRGEYSTVYIDNMSTGMMVSRGAFDPQSRTLNESGTFSCPVTGDTNVSSRSVLALGDKDHYTYTTYVAGLDGKEAKLMEISYERSEGECCAKKGHECPYAKKKEGSCGGCASKCSKAGKTCDHK